MGRYQGTLHKLIESASASNSANKWNQVLHYLEGHTLQNNNAPQPKFESPLPTYSSPTTELEDELFDQQGPRKDYSPLKIAIKNAPASVIAAMCHLGPEATKLADSRNRLPIHWACRRSPETGDIDKIFQILVQAAPETLVHRDDGGRTPLHWLFWYHAPSRSAALVKILCLSLPVQSLKEIRQPRDSQNERYPLPEIPVPNGKGIPSCAAIVPDARHGAIPLHYAAMQGASKEAIKALIKLYPDSLTHCDRKGRSPLAWYLGAGHLIDNNKRHVCGETNDPNATPWWHIKLAPTLVQLLVSSKVARIKDDMGRTPLHWACHFYARSTLALGTSTLPVKAFQILVDNSIEAVVTCDIDRKTPLHVLFCVVAEQQEHEFQRQVANRTVRDNIDLQNGGPAAFKPSKELVELLLKTPDVDGQDHFRFEAARDEKKPTAASYVEDMNGLLPLHNALKVAADPEIIQLLIQSNPTGLIHASEDELQTPLVHAFNSEFSAPLQSAKTLDLLMAAYVTSRHGTFIDGRVSIKMEDANGNYPLHYAVQYQASIEVIRMFVEKFPHSALHRNGEGDLPLHCLLSQNGLFVQPTHNIYRGATLARKIVGLQTEKEIEWQKKLNEAYRAKMKILIEPLRSKQFLKLASSAHGMTPLHIAVAFRAVPYATISQILYVYPDAAAAVTTSKGFEFSCLDLHEMTREDAEDNDEWGAIRELLFAFNPTVEEYRNKEELLDACVQLIRNEIKGKGSYHLSQIHGGAISDYASIDLKDTLSTLSVPEIDVSYRPPSRKNKPVNNAKQARKITKAKKSLSLGLNATFSFTGEKIVEKSIYDDDNLGERYVVSPVNSVEDDDEDFLSSHEEEDDDCFSDEESESGSGEGTSFEQSTNPSSWDQGLNDPSGTFDSSRKSAASKQSTVSSARKENLQSWANKPKPGNSPLHTEEKKEETTDEPVQREVVLSDVAMRLWCFFLLYHDAKNPEDNYVDLVKAITEELDFDTLQQLTSWPVPEYAKSYLDQGGSLHGVTLGDVACPTSMALFKSFHYFLGKYEFPTDLDGMLLHRNSDGNTIYVKAIEHTFVTKEYLEKQDFAPGEAEETIWETGEKLEEEGGYEASKFIDKKRTVCIKLTKNQEAYDNEVECRAHLGVGRGAETLSNILPLLRDLSTSSDDKESRKYVIDVNDERFRNLKLVGGETIRLSEYPYALIYPYSDEGDLFDFFYHHGLDDIDSIADVGRQVAAALRMMHEKGVIHGNMSMRHISMIPFDDESGRRMWAVSDFSTASRSKNETVFLGTISANGSAQFKTGLLPPEMFVKLTASESRIYQTYWEMVEGTYNVSVDKKVVEPFVNLKTGETYVLRCHYVPARKNLDVALPELPYQLVVARESVDIWCFGLILFTLCSGGRPLFPSNLKTGHLLEYESIVGWTSDKAAARIYEDIQDPIAQDLLLHLLAPFENRADLTMEKVLDHPFFNKAADASNLLGKIIDKRQNESAAYGRHRQQVVSEKTEDSWLEGRTTSVECWNFDLLRKFSFSSTTIVSKLLGQRTGALSMPCNFILLPYKLSAKNKKAKLAPTTKKDVERAERMGVLLLSLAKACVFVSAVKSVVEKSEKKQWTVTTLLEELRLPDGHFRAVEESFMSIAAEQVEEFRSNPVSVGRRLIGRFITDIRKFFKHAGRAFLYLVDEYAGIPLVGGAYAPYPLEVAESVVDKFLVRALPFMHISAIYARGAAGGVSGLVRLIFEAAYPHVPPSWTSTAAGISHILDEKTFIDEFNLLREAIALLHSSKADYLSDDLRFVRDSCLKIDTRGSFAHMHRVSAAGYSLWTTKQGAADIEKSCNRYGFKHALEIQNNLEERIRAQEEHIKMLQAEMERLKFQTEMKLVVPDSSNSTRVISNLAPTVQTSIPMRHVEIQHQDSHGEQSKNTPQRGSSKAKDSTPGKDVFQENTSGNVSPTACPETSGSRTPMASNKSSKAPLSASSKSETVHEDNTEQRMAMKISGVSATEFRTESSPSSPKVQSPSPASQSKRDGKSYESREAPGMGNANSNEEETRTPETDETKMLIEDVSVKSASLREAMSLD